MTGLESLRSGTFYPAYLIAIEDIQERYEDRMVTFNTFLSFVINILKYDYDN